MNNIFENAYFGKVYKTRDERKAIYLGTEKLDTCPLYHILNIENFCSYRDVNKYMNNGFVCGEDSSLDIISEWVEHIDEEKLDVITEVYVRSNYPEDNVFAGYCRRDYKAGFRKAIEEYL